MALRKAHQDAIDALVRDGKLDAPDGIVFSRELELIETQTYDVLYPDLKGRSMLPAFTGLRPTDEVWTWRQMDKVRSMAVEGELTSDDFPTVDVQMDEAHSGVVDLLQGYFYTVDEIAKSRVLNRPLDSIRAGLAREAVERKIDKMIAIGSVNAASNGIYGFLNQPLSTASGYVDSMSTTASGSLKLPPGAGNSGAAHLWSNDGISGASTNTLTPKEIVAQLNAARNYVMVNTQGVHQPDTLVLDLTSYLYIDTTPCSQADTNFAGSVMTVMQYIRQNAPWLKSIDWWLECNTAGPSGKARSVLYEKKQANGCYAVPLEFTQSPVQVKNFKFWIPCRAKCAGVKIRYPKSLVYLDGLQP